MRSWGPESNRPCPEVISRPCPLKRVENWPRDSESPSLRPLLRPTRMSMMPSWLWLRPLWSARSRKPDPSNIRPIRPKLWRSPIPERRRERREAAVSNGEAYLICVPVCLLETEGRFGGMGEEWRQRKGWKAGEIDWRNTKGSFWRVFAEDTRRWKKQSDA